MFSKTISSTLSALAIACALTSTLVSATFTPNLEFGLLTINSGTPVHLLGLSINEDGRLGYLSNSRDPFIGKFAPDGRVYVPGINSTYLTVGGVNRTSLQLARGANISTHFDVDSEGHFTYNGSSLFVAVNEGSGVASGPGSPGGPTGSLYRYYVYDTRLLADIGSREYYAVALRVLWSQSGKGLAAGEGLSEGSTSLSTGNNVTAALNDSVVVSNYTGNGSVLSQVSGGASSTAAASYTAVGIVVLTLLAFIGNEVLLA